MSVGDSGGVRSFGGAGGSSPGGGIAIGDPVTGGGANRILFEDGSQNLASDAGLLFDGSIFGLSKAVGGSEVSMYVVNSSSDDNSLAKSSVFAEAAYTELTAKCDLDGALASLELNNGGGHSALLFIDDTDVGALSIDGGNVFTFNGTTFEVVDVLKINNTVSAAVATVSTHRVAINIGGNDYFILMTNVA